MRLFVVKPERQRHGFPSCFQCRHRRQRTARAQGSDPQLPQGSYLPLIVATIVSGVVGYASIWFLLRFLRTHSTGIFIIYRLELRGDYLRAAGWIYFSEVKQTVSLRR